MEKSNIYGIDCKSFDLISILGFKSLSPLLFVNETKCGRREGGWGRGLGGVEVSLPLMVILVINA